TTNPEGAGKWGADLNQYFHGRRVRIHEDNDDAGRAHVAKVASELRGIAKEIMVVRYPELTEHGDFSDFMDNGGTLKAMVARARPAADEVDELEFDESTDICGIDWLWPDRFAKGKIGLIAGLPDMGKGNIAAFICAAITNEASLHAGEGHTPQGDVIWFSSED